MEVQTTERPATEAWAEEHPIRHARLVDQIAAKYPITEVANGVRPTTGDYCVWGAVGLYFGWNYERVGKSKGWPTTSETIASASGGRLDRTLVCRGMVAHDASRPSAEVWNLVDKALRAAGLC